MPELDANIARFYFESPNIAPEALLVGRFHGYEAISRLCRFDLTLVSNDPFINFETLINQPAALTIMRGDEPVYYQGIISAFQQRGRTVDYIVYQAVIVPRLWRLSLSFQSRIFQHLTVQEIIDEVLKGAGFTPVDYRFELNESYPTREYCVQYQETDLAFISRLMEHEGIFYFFEHDGERETLVIADAQDSFKPLDGESTIRYHQGAGLVGDEIERVNGLNCRERMVTGKVVLKDYNYRTPDVNLQVESQLNGTMPGMYYEYGDHYKEVDEGQRLARVRNEAIECRRKVLEGEGDCAGFRSGYSFTLAEHYRSNLDEDYLLTRVGHEGSQWRAMGLVDPAREEGDGEGHTRYWNRFECIPVSTPFRPAQVTPEPRVPGIMTAKVESSGGDYADIDDAGRYQARMHFDNGDAATAEATRPIRMSQPHSGPDYGMHFPNHADTELVWACIDGDVDRPLALGTVPNPNNTSPSVVANNFQNILRTKAGNQMVMDDTIDKAQIIINTPDLNKILLDDKDDRIRIITTNHHMITLDDKNANIIVQTTSGHFLKMQDGSQEAKGKITLQSCEGHFMTIDDEEEVITIADKDQKHQFTIDIGGNKLIIKTEEGDIDIHAPEGHIDIHAKTLTSWTKGDTNFSAANIHSKADQDYTVEAENITETAGSYSESAGSVTSSAGQDHKISAGANAESKAGGVNTVKGATVEVKASGMADIKGAIVAINC